MKPFRLKDKQTNELTGPWLIKVKVPGKGWERLVGHPTSYDEALKKQWKIEEQIKEGTYVPGRRRRTKKPSLRPPVSWGELVEKYIEAHPRSACTEKNYKDAAARIERVIPEDTTLATLRPDLLRDARDELKRLRQRNTSRKRYERSTLNITVTFWRAVLDWGESREYPGLRTGLAKALDTFRSEGTRTAPGNCKQIGPDDFFTQEECQQLVAEAEKSEDQRAACLLHFAFGTGSRVGEIVGAKWKDLLLDDRLFNLRRQAGGRSPKSGLERVVPLKPELVQRLRQWRLASAYSEDNDPVFARANGTHYSKSFKFKAMLRRVAEKCELTRPRYYHHMTRHSYASNWLREGRSDWMLAKILGHKDTRLIHHVYAHVLTTDLLAELDRPQRPTERPKSVGISGDR